MSARVVVPPASLAVTLAAAKKNLRIDGIYLDDVIELWLEGVIAFAENRTDRALINQTWRLTIAEFPANGAIELRRPPLVNVVHVKYFDVNNVLQTLDPSVYLVDTTSAPGKLAPLGALTWPATYQRSDAVEIQYECGYGADATAIPKDLKLYILAKLAEQFDPLTRPDKETVQTTFIDRLLDEFIIY